MSDTTLMLAARAGTLENSTQLNTTQIESIEYFPYFFIQDSVKPSICLSKKEQMSTVVIPKDRPHWWKLSYMVIPNNNTH